MQSDRLEGLNSNTTNQSSYKVQQQQQQQQQQNNNNNNNQPIFQNTPLISNEHIINTKQHEHNNNTNTITTYPQQQQHLNTQHHQQHLNTHENQIQTAPPIYRASDVAYAVRRNKKRKLGIENLCSGNLNIPESEIFQKLIHMEKKLDKSIQYRCASIADNLSESVPENIVIRFYMIGEFIKGNAEADLSFWKLRLTGRLLESDEISTDDNLNTKMTQQQNRMQQQRPFSSYLNKMEITLQNMNTKATEKIEWKNEIKEKANDCFEIQRPGENSTSIEVKLYFEREATLYTVSKPMSEILKIECGTRGTILKSFWEYIKVNEVVSTENPNVIKCNEELKSIFNEDEILMSSISKRIGVYLQALDPIELKHEIKCEIKEKQISVYDITVPLNDTEYIRTLPMGLKLTMDKFEKQIIEINNNIIEKIEKVEELERKRKFLLGFSDDPCGFIKALIIQQEKELRFVIGPAGVRQYQAESQTEIFNQKWVEDAVMRYLQKRTAAGF